MGILITLILPIHEHRIFSHVFMYSSVSFSKLLWFLLYQCFTFLVKIIPKYFVVFKVILNEIDFFIFFRCYIIKSMNRNIIGFCMLILYLATLLKLPTTYNTFSDWDFQYTSPYYLWITTVLLLLFWIWMSFISLSHQIAPVRISAVLNKSDKRGPLCLVTDLRWKAFNFFPLSIMLIVCFLYMAFSWGMFHLCPICGVFLLWKDVVVCQIILLYPMRWSRYLSFIFLKTYIYCICWTILASQG